MKGVVWSVGLAHGMNDAIGYIDLWQFRPILTCDFAKRNPDSFQEKELIVYPQDASIYDIK